MKTLDSSVWSQADLQYKTEEAKHKLNQRMLKYCKKECGISELEYRCMFDNGDWDYETMCRFIIGNLGVVQEFEDEMLTFYPECMTDKYLIKRGQY